MKKIFYFIITFMFIGVVHAQQVSLTATSGTGSGSFTTLKEAFDAINLGAHQGAIVISIYASTTESTTAVLEASGANGFSSYTSISIYPTSDGVSISGSIDGNSIIRLSGADNVTIDGRVNANGSSKSLTITNTSVSNLSGTSTIQFFGDASSNTVKYCMLKGSTTNTTSGIVFFNIGTSTGNDNNTIDNNDITCAGTNRPLYAVYALGSSASYNDNNTISNNNIYNVLSTTIGSRGINIANYNSGYTISGNSFYETTSFVASGHSTPYYVISINAVGGTEKGFTISGNYIGGSAARCAGTAWTKRNTVAENNGFYAISVITAAGTASSIQGNTVQNINWENGGSANFFGIFSGGATVVNIGTISGNTIGSASGTGSLYFTVGAAAATFYAIFGTGSGTTICSNNTIGAITTANASSNFSANFVGIFNNRVGTGHIVSDNTIVNITASSASTTVGQTMYGIRLTGLGSCTISSNTVANMLNATNSTLNSTTIGITGEGTSVSTITGNTVRDISSAVNNTDVYQVASVMGILIASTASAAHTVSRNTIYNLSNSSPSFAGGVTGIFFRGTSTASTVSSNFIHSLSVTGASSTAATLLGIRIDAGTTTYSNNIISLGGNTNTNIIGIAEAGATGTASSLYFNTVYLSGSLSPIGGNTSYALHSTATIGTKDFRNNVLVNARSTSGGTNKHYALWFGSGGTVTCDYNNYYVSGSGGMLGFEGGINVPSLPIVTSNDVNSIATNPSFVSTGTTASGYAPSVAGTAVDGTGITVDYNGNSRGASLTMGALPLSCSNPTNGGTIATAQSGASGFDPVAFTSSAAASGHTGTLEYKWQSSTTSSSSGFSDIASSNATTYDAGALTQTTWFKRLARVDCASDWSGAVESNIVELLVDPNLTIWTGAQSTAWNTPGNWSSNAVPISTSYVTIAAVANQPVISSDVAINTLTLNTGTSLMVSTGFNLTVTNYIHNSGTLTVANNANLLQDTAIITNSNIGSITVERDSSSLLRLDHTLWSSPVASQNLFSFSPATLTNRFYVYDTAANVYSTTGLSALTTFAAGKGYAVRAPNDHSSTSPTIWTGTFSGKPNNGTIPFTLSTASSGYNLVGNPYPSPISASLFLTDNSAKIEGTLYFYSHSLTMNANGTFPSGTNYSSWNGSAGTAATTAAAGDFHPIPVTPNGVIQVGQGFFVKAKNNASGDINFTNAMRVTNNANQFLRTKEIERHRLWLNLTTENDIDINQIAVAYVEGATQGVDSNFDGLVFGNTGSSLSSKVNGADYVIQGRSLPFDSNDRVSLGFKALTAGNFKIKLTNKDGLFLGNQDVFVRDNLMGIEHNIKVSPYTFTSNTGTFDSRFELVYTQALGIPSTDFTSNSVIVYKNTDWFHVSTKGITMKEIQVYDVSGRLIYKQSDINATTAVLKGLTQTKDVLFLKITSEDNLTVTVKAIN